MMALGNNLYRVIKMKQVFFFCFAFIALLAMFMWQTKSQAGTMQMQEIIIALTGTAKTEAAFFPAKQERAVIFAPGAMFSKESWYFLAERFQMMGFSSLALDSGATPDLLNSIAYLRDRGIEKIAIIGASAGGAGVLFTLGEQQIDPRVDTVVLLAPAGGEPLQSKTVRKLFIVSEDDMISSNAEVYNLYDASADPKVYKELKGSDHAQRLFDSDQKETVVQLIIDFIVQAQ
jgi:pimeloyl-ACP methyl ester carboxylesterase